MIAAGTAGETERWWCAGEAPRTPLAVGRAEAGGASGTPRQGAAGTHRSGRMWPGGRSGLARTDSSGLSQRELAPFAGGWPTTSLHPDSFAHT